MLSKIINNFKMKIEKDPDEKYEEALCRDLMDSDRFTECADSQYIDCTTDGRREFTCTDVVEDDSDFCVDCPDLLECTASFEKEIAATCAGKCELPKDK